MKIAKLLRDILSQSGLTQVQLAARLNVSHQSLSKWLNESSAPRASKIAAIESLAIELLGGDVAKELVDKTVARAESLTLNIDELLMNNQMLNRFVVLLTYNTNSIEGSTMTLADTEKVLLEQRVLANRSAREQLEARNHQAALMWLLDQVNTGKFSVNLQTVSELHQRLMNGLVIDAGEYRQHGVRIMGSRVTVANFLKVPEMMDELFDCRFTSKVDNLASLHATFEKIHPFSDGNGRVGRLLMTGIALAEGQMPPIIKREARSAYYGSLEKAQVECDYLNLEYFIAKSIIDAHKELRKERH